MEVMEIGGRTHEPACVGCWVCCVGAVPGPLRERAVRGGPGGSGTWPRRSAPGPCERARTLGCRIWRALRGGLPLRPAGRSDPKARSGNCVNRVSRVFLGQHDDRVTFPTPWLLVRPTGQGFLACLLPVME